MNSKKYLDFSSKLDPNEKGLFQILSEQVIESTFPNTDIKYYNLPGRIFSLEGNKIYYPEELRLDLQFISEHKDLLIEGSYLPIICVENKSQIGNYYKTNVIDRTEIQNIENLVHNVKKGSNALIESHKCERLDYDLQVHPEEACCGLEYGTSTNGEEYSNIYGSQLINIGINIYDESKDGLNCHLFHIDKKSSKLLYSYQNSDHYVIVGEFRFCKRCYYTLNYHDHIYNVRMKESDIEIIKPNDLENIDIKSDFELFNFSFGIKEPLLFFDYSSLDDIFRHVNFHSKDESLSKFNLIRSKPILYVIG